MPNEAETSEQLRSLEISRAMAGDEPVIGAFLEDARHRLADAGILQWTVPLSDVWIASNVAAGKFWVARHDATPVAVVRLLWSDPAFWGDRDDGSAACIHSLPVHRDSAGEGIGAAVMRWAGAQARSRG